jgi:pimeloyl-ACP methyl ester carboxylesterase
LIQKLLRSPLGPLVARLTSRRAFAANLRRIFGPQTPPSPEELDGFWTLVSANDGRRILPRLIQYMAERRRHRARWVGALQHTKVPLKLIDGVADPISGVQLVRRYRELISPADVTELPGIGHYPQVESPAAVLQAYLDFRRDRVDI